MIITAPSKSFFIGEYLVLSGGSALMAALLPRFELIVTRGQGAVRGIAPASPAGRWIAEHRAFFESTDIEFVDPHAGAGGWGASTAQFLTCYAATCQDAADAIDVEAMRLAYVDSAWDGAGSPPSGADLVAQLEGGLVEFSRASGVLRKHAWPFDDLEFYFVATGNKVATHEHLRQILHIDATPLSAHAEHVCAALRTRESSRFVEGVQSYAQELERQSLVHRDTLALLEDVAALPGVLAAKGCGALGADVILALVQVDRAAPFKASVQSTLGTPIGREQLDGGLAIQP